MREFIPIAAERPEIKTRTVLKAAVGRHKRLLVPEVLKRNNFDVMRLVLAVAVLFSHCYAIYYGMEGIAREPLKILTRGQTDFGALAVNCFFIISGFLILNSFLHSATLKRYLTKRALRICPGFITAFLLSVFVFALLGNIEYQKTLINWTRYFHSIPLKRLAYEFILFKQPGYSSCFTSLPLPNVVNGSLWTIQYELLCYMALPLLGFLGLLKRMGNPCDVCGVL